MSFSQNEATRTVKAIDRRVAKMIGRGVVLELTHGEVYAVGAGVCSVFLGGDTNASEGFRIPAGMVVESGDKVRVAIDPRGHRYIEEVFPATTYSMLVVDPVRGTILLGDGSGAPTLGAANRYLRVNPAGTGMLWDTGPAAGSVTAQTSFGLSSSNGSASTFSHSDHTHGTPTDPVTAHVAAADPHTGYQKESGKDAASGYVGLDASENAVIAGDLTVSGGIFGTEPILRKYTSSTSWSKPANLSHIIVECVGGGGAGGGSVTGAAGEHSQGGGGGAGSYAKKILAAGNVNSSVTVTVGAGGTGVSGGDGNDGNDSSFGAHCIGKAGGGGGHSATSSATYSGALGGAGGVAGTGDLATPAQPGGWGFGSGPLATGGVGGGGPWGGGGQPTTLISQPGSAAGGAGQGYGSGGAGGVRTGTGAANAGGAGKQGIVLVWEYYAP